MRCPSCDHDNRAERRFCAEYGAALAAVRASCGASNEGFDMRDLIDAKALLEDLRS